MIIGSLSYRRNSPTIKFYILHRKYFHSQVIFERVKGHLSKFLGEFHNTLKFEREIFMCFLQVPKASSMNIE